MEMNKQDKMTADEALATLLEGNKRFVEGKQIFPNHDLQQRKLVSSGQDPIATVVTCSDSRVPPVSIFDRGVGDLFVIRIAGNIIDDHALGSIEYSVKVLETPLVIIMGHSSCGAVAAVADGVKLDGHMASFVPVIQAAVKRAGGGPDLGERSARELALMMAEKVAGSEPIISDYVTQGKVKVVPMYYSLESGAVSLLNR